MPGNHGEVVDAAEKPSRSPRRNWADTRTGRLVFAKTLA
ncbi:hypothetical protein J2W76_002258 [Methylorubrum zatmanii]|nr:hypothetical protein [Methylorubrum zatmanii]MCP1579315.1 hypothetical protein [Methylorubrum extorquens]